MSIDISTLQARARTAKPGFLRRRPGPVGRWTPLWPVYAELRRQGLSIREAVDWLIQEGAVQEEHRKKAEYGLPMVESRMRRKETAAAQAAEPGSRKR